MRRALTIWATIRMETCVLILMTGVVALTRRVAIRQLRGMGRRCAAWERAIARHGGRYKVIASASASTSLVWMWRNVGHLMRLVVGILHHLLISPLCSQLCVSLIVVWILKMHLSWGRMAVHWERLLVGILVERGVVRLVWVLRCRPSCLLLLHRIRVRLLGYWCGCAGMVVSGGGPLARNSGVDSVGRRVHLQISRWMPVLRSENGHGQKQVQIT